MYNVVHTGPNNQFGGAHEGLDSVEYHVGICEWLLSITQISNYQGN